VKASCLQLRVVKRNKSSLKEFLNLYRGEVNLAIRITREGKQLSEDGIITSEGFIPTQLDNPSK